MRTRAKSRSNGAESGYSSPPSRSARRIVAGEGVILGNPFEDQIFEFILARRPLKIACLAIALVGLAKPVVETGEVIYAHGSPYITRALNIKPSPDKLEKYGCAFQAGAAYWQTSLRTGLLTGTPGASFPTLWLPSLARCMAMFDFALFPYSRRYEAGGSLTEAERYALVERLAQSTLTFEGYLANKDPTAALLFRLSGRLVELRVTMGLERRRAMDTPPPKGAAAIEEWVAGAPNKVQLDQAADIEILYKRAREKFPYRLPELKLDKSTKQKLLDSASDGEGTIANYFGEKG